MQPGGIFAFHLESSAMGNNKKIYFMVKKYILRIFGGICRTEVPDSHYFSMLYSSVEIIQDAR